MIQKGGNYIFLHTYTFTIDIVPLVLRDYCFAGHIHEYKGIIIKICHQTKCNADHTLKNEKMAHPTCKTRASTDVARTQAYPGAHLLKGGGEAG